MSRLTLRNIEIFIAAIEEGSVAAAARRLETSPSSISQHLSNLEEDLGTTIIDRTKRPLALTPAGVLFHRRASNILNEAMRARAELAAADFTALSHLALAVIDDFEPDVTPALMAALSADMPDCHIVLQTGASHENLSALEGRAVDMCIAAEPETPESWMEIYPLLNEPFVLLAPRGAVQPGGPPALAQLQQTPFIRFPRDQVVGRMIEARLTAERLTLPQKFEIDSYQSIMAMVAQGTGWAIAPPMCFLRAQRFQAQVDMLPLPFPITRRISLFARKDTLDRMPKDIATRLRTLIADMLVTQATREHPWLESGFKTL